MKSKIPLVFSLFGIVELILVILIAIQLSTSGELCMSQWIAFTYVFILGIFLFLSVIARIGNYPNLHIPRLVFQCIVLLTCVIVCVLAVTAQYNEELQELIKRECRDFLYYFNYTDNGDL